jgi:hypothetical protein
VTMPREWVRGPQWASDAARETWEPILRRAQAAWQELELLSVSEGLRGSALVYLAADELPVASADCARAGLVVSVLAVEPRGLRAAIHGEGLAQAWHTAWSNGDDGRIGELLGFPACCRAFFRRTWTAGSCDPTPAMPTVEGPWQGNILLRWLGVRLVPHLPCSGQCEATLAQAQGFLAAGQRAGLDMDAVQELLQLPVSYSSLNGVAIVETPHFRFMAGADPSPQELRFRRLADGLVAMHPHESLEPAASSRRWEDNGFGSEAAMRSAHAVVLAAVPELPPGEQVLDLGCGDGALLEEIRRREPKSRCYGLDLDGGRLERGRRRHPHLVLVDQRIEDWTPGRPGLVLFMPGRLLEMAPERADQVRQQLRENARRLVLYAYGDVLARDGGEGGLAWLAQRAGLELVGPVHRGPGVEAAEGRVKGRG